METGVYLHKKTGKFACQINRDGVRYFLGLHPTELKAASVRAAFESTLPQKNPPARPPSSGSLTQARLCELFSYNEFAGDFIWKARTSRRVSVGDVAGHRTNQGYLAIRVDGRLYLAHRLVWLYVYGEFPTHEIDHRDGCGTNNRLPNLRPATSSENKQNSRIRCDNKLGHTGIFLNKRTEKYVAVIYVGGRKFNLGEFALLSDAIRARRRAKINLHPFQPIQRGA